MYKQEALRFSETLIKNKEQQVKYLGQEKKTKKVVKKSKRRRMSASA